MDPLVTLILIIILIVIIVIVVKKLKEHIAKEAKKAKERAEEEAKEEARRRKQEQINTLVPKYMNNPYTIEAAKRFTNEFIIRVNDLSRDIRQTNVSCSFVIDKLKHLFLSCFL